MPTIHDNEFGNIALRRSGRSTSIRARILPNGQLRVSMPSYTPIFFAKRFINASRAQLRSLFSEHNQITLKLTDGMTIGKSHRLTVESTAGPTSAKRKKQQIIVSLNQNDELADNEVLTIARKTIIDALRIEAKSYLPKRLEFLGARHGFSYQSVRFSHASGRWGSCSTSGTISLNIALMKLPFELIDYVLIHELTHTVQMNHSKKFWELVGEADPNFQSHRKQLKLESPAI